VPFLTISSCVKSQLAYLAPVGIGRGADSAWYCTKEAHDRRRGPDQAGREVDRRSARRSPGRRSRDAGRRGGATLRPVPARHGLPLPHLAERGRSERER
jgi:hypothetical protein